MSRWENYKTKAKAMREGPADLNPSIKGRNKVADSKFGKEEMSDEEMQKKRICPECKGRGKTKDQEFSDEDHIRYKKCDTCKGTGKI